MEHPKLTSLVYIIGFMHHEREREREREGKGDRQRAYFSKTALYHKRLSIYLWKWDFKGQDNRFLIMPWQDFFSLSHTLRKLIVSNQAYFKLYLTKTNCHLLDGEKCIQCMIYVRYQDVTVAIVLQRYQTLLMTPQHGNTINRTHAPKKTFNVYKRTWWDPGKKEKTKQAYDQQRNYLTANREQGTLTKVKSHRFILGKLWQKRPLSSNTATSLFHRCIDISRHTNYIRQNTFNIFTIMVKALTNIPKNYDILSSLSDAGQTSWK